MSSFICTSKHFTSIEKKMHQLINKDDYYTPYELREVCPKNYDKRNNLIETMEAEISKHIDTLRTLNAVCVILQYKHHYKGTVNAQISSEVNEVHRKSQPVELTTMGVYKALKCVIYQIELNHLEELRELRTEEKNAMKYIKETISFLATYILTNSEEWEKAAYTID
jgi:hypothetical protein